MTRATTCALLSGPVAVLAMSCGAPSQSPADSVVGPVATARNTQCATIGPAVARYLSTGDNGGDPSFDTKFAEDRRYILTSPADAQNGLIRADANYATAKCDQKIDADTAAQAAAAEQQRAADAQRRIDDENTRAAAATAAARAAGLVKARGQCLKLGGNWIDGDNTCPIDYRSPVDGQVYHYAVLFDPAGNVTPGAVRDAAACTTSYGPGVTGRWHADTDICAL